MLNGAGIPMILNGVHINVLRLCKVFNICKEKIKPLIYLYACTYIFTCLRTHVFDERYVCMCVI